jgi:hypothetical protein
MLVPSQGILLIAIVVSLIIGMVIGYFLRQGRIGELLQALKQIQRRSEDMEQDHQQRLREATLRLQQDYEAQLAEKIERYQDQLEERINQLEQEYQGRLSVVAQGQQGGMAGAAAPGFGGITPNLGSDVPADLQAVEQHIRRQYEDRLREAARKIQQAYEQHLRQKLRDARDLLQQDYEQRLAQKIEHYEAQTASRLEQLQGEYDLRLQVMEPAAPAAGAGWDTTVTLGAGQPAVTPPPALPEQALQQLETQLRQEYEQKLAEKIEHYQDDLAQRVQSLEAEYEARLQMSLQAQPGQFQPEPPEAGQVGETDVANLEVTETPYCEPEVPLPAQSLEPGTDGLADPAALLDPSATTPDLEIPGPIEGDFSLDDVLLSPDQPTGAEEDLNLDSDFDAQDFNLDELLFEQTPAEGSDPLPPDLDDISRLS